MPPSRKQLGTLGEKLALEHLRKRGYHIVETNFRCREGEIDIIARDRALANPPPQTKILKKIL